jgi:hypothetical protein
MNPSGQDPYHSASRELEQKVQLVEQSLNDWKAVRSSNSSAADYTRQKIMADLNASSTLQKALEDSFRFISQNPARFPNITPTELANRRSFVESLTARLQSVRTQIEEAPATPASVRTRTTREELIRRAGEDRNQRFINDELDHQRNMAKEQDKMIDRIDESSATILHIAKGIGQGLIDNNERLEGTPETQMIDGTTLIN